MAKAADRKSSVDAGPGRKPPTAVQAVAWEVKGGVRGSLTALSRVTGISLDSLRLSKRQPGTAGFRPLPVSRARFLALVLAAHRRGILADLLDDADVIQRDWRRRFPNGVAT